MGKITAVTERGQGKRVSVSLDGRFAFSLETEVAAKEGLRVGQELSAEYIELLARSDLLHLCLNAAGQFLRYRPRSESEIRGRLNWRGFDSDSIEAAVARLKEQGLVDDVAFAQFWKENRESFSPRSRGLTKLELIRKGVAKEIIDQVVDDIDDANGAYRAAMKKVRSLSSSDYHGFRRRLGEYLRRLGFNWEVINDTVERVWQEQGNRSG